MEGGCHAHFYFSAGGFTPHGFEDILARSRKRGQEQEESSLPLNLSVKGRRKEGVQEGGQEVEEEAGGRRKKMRTTFTGRQIFEMEKMFETKKYLNAGERSHLSRWNIVQDLAIANPG